MISHLQDAEQLLHVGPLRLQQLVHDMPTGRERGRGGVRWDEGFLGGSVQKDRHTAPEITSFNRFHTVHLPRNLIRDERG